MWATACGMASSGSIPRRLLQVCYYLVLYYYDHMFSHWSRSNNELNLKLKCHGHTGPANFARKKSHGMKNANFNHFFSLWAIGYFFLPQSFKIDISHTFRSCRLLQYPKALAAAALRRTWSQVPTMAEPISRWTCSVTGHTQWTCGRNSTVLGLCLSKHRECAEGNYYKLPVMMYNYVRLRVINKSLT